MTAFNFDLSQPKERKLLSDALTQLSIFEKIEPLDAFMPIRLDSILSFTWHEGRLENCLEMLKKGRHAPPVYLTKFDLYDWGITLYTVDDGNHRVEAARSMNRSKITAGVQSVMPVQARYYRIWQNKVWYSPAPGNFDYRQISVSNLNVTIIEAIEKLGVAKLGNL